MKLTKNQIVIVAVLVVGIIAYFMFFKKKGTKSTSKEKDVKKAADVAKNAADVAQNAANVAKDAAAAAESAYDGIYEYTAQDLMRAVSTPGGADYNSSYDGLPEAVTAASLRNKDAFNHNWLY